MDASGRDLKVAIAALSQAMVALEWRLSDLGQALADLQGERQRWLIGTAATLLPSLSSGALNLLESRVDGFVTPHIRDACQQHRKWLGLFAGKDYAQALAVVQTRLASHLDRQNWGQLSAFDDELQARSNEQRWVHAVREDARELSRRLEQARRDGTPLSPALREQVRHIVQLSKPVVRESVENDDRDDDRDDRWDWDSDRDGGASSSSSSSSLSDDATDLWAYLTTDLPVSLRTLAIDTFTPQPLPIPELEQAADPISTDDSLGRFS